MNGGTSSSTLAERLPSSHGDTEVTKPVEQKAAKPRSQIEADAERIKSAVVRLTSNSIEGLEGLASELQQLQAFLNSEVERVQSEIESALAGINIIVETIAPWRTMSVPTGAPAGPRAVRAGPAANIETMQPRR